MPTRLVGWLAAVLAMLVTLTLVVDELTTAGQRRWWAARPLTTDTVAGLLVLLVTILVVNQLLNRRQARQRGHAIAAQAAIMVAQATRSAKAVSSLINGSGDRGAASDGFRTYMMMLLIGAPVLIDDPVARRFLERAQYLGGVMAGELAVLDRSTDGAAVLGDQTVGAAAPGGRQAGRRVAAASGCCGTASSAPSSRDARFHPGHRPDCRRVGLGGTGGHRGAGAQHRDPAVHRSLAGQAR